MQLEITDKGTKSKDLVVQSDKEIQGILSNTRNGRICSNTAHQRFHT